MNDIQSVEEIKGVVQKNVDLDQEVNEGFEYIDLNHIDNDSEDRLLLFYIENEP